MKYTRSCKKRSSAEFFASFALSFIEASSIQQRAETRWGMTKTVGLIPAA